MSDLCRGALLAGASGFERPSVEVAARVDNCNVDPVGLATNVGSNVYSCSLSARGDGLLLGDPTQRSDEAAENLGDAVVTAGGAATQGAAQEVEFAAIIEVVSAPAGVLGRRDVAKVGAKSAVEGKQVFRIGKAFRDPAHCLEPERML